MAITNYKKQEEIARQSGYTGSGTPYQGMAGVSQNTANNLGNYQQGYQQSDRVNQAQQQLQQVQNNRPQSYNSKYSAQLDSILQQIQNPGEFKYEFNGDNLFKGYADYYTQMGKQASLDTMGQAAGLTGGYGNSYGQMVGQQQYQQYLLPLYDKGLQLQQQAYQRYQDDLGNKKDLYGILQGADEADYGRYRDLVADWRQDEANATNLALTYEQMDRDAYNQALNYWTGMAQVENAAYNTEAERQEAIRQYEQDFAEKQRQYNTSLAEEQRQADLNEGYRRDQLAEQIRQADLDEGYRRDTLAEQIRQANLDEGYRRDTLSEQIRQADLDEGYRRDQLAESIRSTDMDEGYRRDQLAENVRQADLDEAYRQAQLQWQQETDARDYARSVAESDQKYAYNYVMDILANGQMPSVDLLMAAGLSQEDAQKLIAQLQTKSTGTKTTEEPAGEKDESFYDASRRIVASNPQTKATVQQQEAKKEVTQTINSGKLPSTDLISKAGMTTADVLKQAVQQTMSSKSSVLKAGNEIIKSNSALKSKLAKNP